MFLSTHRILPSSLLNSLLIGVSLESRLQTSVDKALFFLSPSSIVTSPGHLQPAKVCSLDNCTQEVSIHSVLHWHLSSPLPYFKMNIKKKLPIVSQQSDTPLLVPKCGLWVVRKQHRIQKNIYFRGFILTAVSQKDSDRWEQV